MVTTSWQETAEILLNSLFSYDDIDDDTVDQEKLRDKMSIEDPNLSDTEIPFTAQEIAKVIRKMKNGKSPGWDAIEVVIIKRAWSLIQNIFLKLFNGCLEQRIFPNEWKKACVITLLKSSKKDPHHTDLSAFYRYSER